VSLADSTWHYWKPQPEIPNFYVVKQHLHFPNNWILPYLLMEPYYPFLNPRPHWPPFPPYFSVGTWLSAMMTIIPSFSYRYLWLKEYNVNVSGWVPWSQKLGWNWKCKVFNSNHHLRKEVCHLWAEEVVLWTLGYPDGDSVLPIAYKTSLSQYSQALIVPFSQPTDRSCSEIHDCKKSNSVQPENTTAKVNCILYS
jgi:hypothetical protein